LFALYFVVLFLVFEVAMATFSVALNKVFITWYVLLIENKLILADLLVLELKR
jgi:hypothetical protein